jgi:hypothetical protein
MPNSGFNTATTISRAQSLLLYPQFQNVWVQEFNGTNRYNALAASGKQEILERVDLNSTYTYSKLRERVSYLNPSDPELEDSRLN